ncbi:MAG: TlpA family protein disulfide reductase, partial [Acidobacteriota bacterium]|nr:TlpA family protein disulfide reductase [Acidobacteriota bacterium]
MSAKQAPGRPVPRGIVFLLLLWFAVLPAASQVRIQKILSSSKINQYQSHHLVLIDFWATWCPPCINVGRQLEVTQEIFKDSLTIISLSNENEPVVQQFVDANHPKLTIALDTDNWTFNHYGVTRSLPYSVLLNQWGNLLWEGHPADLTKAKLTKFIRQNKRLWSRPSAPFITIAEEAGAAPKPAAEDPFSVRFSALAGSYFSETAEGMDFLGPSSRLFAEILKKSKHDVRVKNDPVIQVHIRARDWSAGADAVLGRILAELKMTRLALSEET